MLWLMISRSTYTLAILSPRCINLMATCAQPAPEGVGKLRLPRLASCSPSRAAGPDGWIRDSVVGHHTWDETNNPAHLLASELVERKLHKAIAALVQVLDLLVAGVPLQRLARGTEGHLPRALRPSLSCCLLPTLRCDSLATSPAPYCACAARWRLFATKRLARACPQSWPQYFPACDGAGQDVLMAGPARQPRSSTIDVTRCKDRNLFPRLSSPMPQQRGTGWELLNSLYSQPCTEQ
jgi:hypothetical protein